MKPNMVTTAFELPGYRIVSNKGMVRGVIVRSRSIVGSFFGGLQSILGGNITIYTSMCEQARKDAYLMMCEQAQKNGANAVIGAKYDTTEIMAGMAEVLCYGTAVTVEAITPAPVPPLAAR